MPAGRLEPGQIYTRAQVRALMGGSDQGGIVPANASNTILIYSDHDSGDQYGYVDGWVDEDDAEGPVFEYTGHGHTGDQSVGGRKGAMNNAVFQHVAAGRALHLFTAVGVVPGTQTKMHRYIGEMTLDKRCPMVVRQALDSKQQLRKVVVFRMRSADGRPPEPADMVPPANETATTLVPFDTTTSSIVAPEARKTRASTRSGTSPTMAERRESELTEHFRKYLTQQDHDVKRVQIRVKGTRSTLLTDLYDVTAHVLYEAKSSSSREDIREAIGQLLDYRRHIVPGSPTAAVLLPEKPNDDLQDLIASVGMLLVYRDGDTYVGMWTPDTHEPLQP